MDDVSEQPRNEVPSTNAPIEAGEQVNASDAPLEPATPGVSPSQPHVQGVEAHVGDVLTGQTSESATAGIQSERAQGEQAQGGGARDEETESGGAHAAGDAGAGSGTPGADQHDESAPSSADAPPDAGEDSADGSAEPDEATASQEPTWRRFDLRTERDDALQAAQQAIAAGECIVLPTDTVYGIGANAFSADAVQRLLDAKRRGRDMPPPVLISDPALLQALASDVEGHALQLADECWPGALTLIVTMQPSLRVDLGETRGTIALRVPDHDDTRDLLRRTGPLAVSSANVSGRPASTNIDDAIEMLGNSVSVYLDAGPTPGETPSTMVDFVSTSFGKVVRQGALSIERIHEVAPFVEEFAQEAEPDAPTTDAATPDTSAPDGSVPETSVPDTSAPAAPDPAEAPDVGSSEELTREATIREESDAAEAIPSDPVLPEEAEPDLLGHQHDINPVGTEHQTRGAASGAQPAMPGDADVTPMVADSGEGGAPSDSGLGWPGEAQATASAAAQDGTTATSTPHDDPASSGHEATGSGDGFAAEPTQLTTEPNSNEGDRTVG